MCIYIPHISHSVPRRFTILLFRLPGDWEYKIDPELQATANLCTWGVTWYDVTNNQKWNGSYTTLPHSLTPATGMTTKSCYQYLLSENLRSPHCVMKFLPMFGVLYWSTTRRELFLFDTDWQVIDLSWKIVYGVLYTAARLASFGYDFSTSCFLWSGLRDP